MKTPMRPKLYAGVAAGVVEAFEDEPGSDGLLGDGLEAGELDSATGRLELDDVDG